MIRLLIVGGIPFVAMHRYAPMFRRPAFSIVKEDPLKWLTAFFIHRPPRSALRGRSRGSDEWTVKVHRHGFHDNEMKKKEQANIDTHHHHHNNIISRPDCDADLKQLYRAGRRSALRPNWTGRTFAYTEQRLELPPLELLELPVC